MAQHQASCHCGNIKLSIETNQWQPAIECNCSICRRKGYLLNFFPLSEVKFHTDISKLPIYLFNKKVISHYFCPTCGVSPFCMSKDDQGKQTVALNLRCVEGIDLASLKVRPYNGKDVD